MATTKQPRTLQEAILYYADEGRCHKELVAARWPNGVVCPTCKRTDVSFLKSQNRFQCKSRHAKRQFSAKVGSIFEDSALPLTKWMPAIWLIVNAKNGVSSYELSRSLGFTQKTAWFVLHRIRLAMQTGSFEKMTGEVEVDESYVGGKVKNMHAAKRASFRGNRWGGKVAVMGLLERNTSGASTVRTAVVRGVKGHELREVIDQHVTPNTKIYTDALLSYRQLSDQYQHEFVDHMESYAKGAVHTNGLESFWAMLKRTLGGTYISVEPFHLSRYVDEQAFRFNTRKLTDSQRFLDTLARVSGKRLTYNELIEAERKIA